MLIFVFVNFSVLLLLSLLCSYVVKLGKAQNTKNKKKQKIKHPKKVEVLPGIFTRQVMVACAKVIAFLLGCFVVFLVAQKHYKIGF